MHKWQGLKLEAEGTGISKPLSYQVNLLGDLLGHVIREQGGEYIFNLVEFLRKQSKKANLTNDESAYKKISNKLKTLTYNEILWLVRSYTKFFHLINQAERQEIVRINREREQLSSAEIPRKESIKEAICRMKQQGVPFEELCEIIQQMDIQPTLTAHPSEARRQSILFKQKKITQLLSQLGFQHELSKKEIDDIYSQIYHQIALLFLTLDVRSENLTVEEEISNVLYFLRTSIWESIPKIYQDLQEALKIYYDRQIDLPTFLQYRTWIGGDRDGNPFVTPEITRKAFQYFHVTALNLFRKELVELRRELSLSSLRIKTPEELINSLDIDAKNITLSPIRQLRYQHEPYRLKVSYMIKKIDVVLSDPEKNALYYTKSNFLDDLLLIKSCLESNGLQNFAQFGHLSDLIIRAQVFGFHMIMLDIRQHSKVHQSVVAELLQLANVTVDYEDLSETKKCQVIEKELMNPRPLIPHNAKLSEKAIMVLQTFEVIKEAVKLDNNIIGSYVVSMTHNVSDILEVLLLAKETGLWQTTNEQQQFPFDIVPLFETIEDLKNAKNLMDKLFKNEVYHICLKSRNNFQEMMLGFSDSNKDGGYWMANWALHKAQEELAEICNKYNIKFRLFHGRGGTIGRGGGRANQAIFAMPKISQNSRIRFTEQGEVISYRYAQAHIACRNLEQMVNAVLQTSYKYQQENNYTPEMYKIMESIAQLSMKTYRKLIFNTDFWEWYKKITPIEYIGNLPMASRPVSRKSTKELDFENIRAIPWVFAWTQTRYTLPGWYGIGEALKSVIAEKKENLTILQKMYKVWPFFQAVINNAEREMTRAKLNIAGYYSKNSEKFFHNKIQSDYKKASKAIIAITGHHDLLGNQPVIQKSILLRNPYTDVLNLLQIELIRRIENATDDEKEACQHALFISINGIAAAMQSTG